MPRQLVECVPNFSEGRDLGKLESIAQAILAVPDVLLLDRQSDPDHNRGVMTFVGPPNAVAAAAFRAVEKAVALIDLTQHTGAHPRIGAADVLPFIPIEGVTLEECARLAERVGQEIWAKLHLPVYLYEAASRRPERVHLENIRKGQFEALLAEMGKVAARDPDIGDPVCHPTAGAIAVGARQFLIAYNINLNTPDLSIAKRIARTIRFSNGGFRYVKAMGVLLRSRNLAQVSINLTDFEQTPMHLVFETVRREAQRYGVDVAGSEIVGLIPQRSLDLSAQYFLRLENFRPELVLENRIAQALSVRGGLADFLDSLASPATPRGGGSAAAAAAAMAAVLGSRVASLANLDPTPFDADRYFFTAAVERDAGVEAALHGAAEVPLEVMERSHALAARLEALDIPARLASDLAVAKLLVSAARAGARENAKVNLASVQDTEVKAAIERRIHALDVAV